MLSRTRSRLMRGTVLVLSCTALSACGGWVDEGECLICPIEAPPSLSPPRTVALVTGVTPAGAGSNSDRVIWSEALDDEEVTGALSFRLVQAVRNTDYSQPALAQSAPNITEAGATLTIDIPEDPDADEEVRFTIKDPGMGVQDVVLEEVPGAPQLQATLPDGRIVRVTLDMTDQNSASVDGELFWTAYGAWNVSNPTGTVQTASYFVTGDETPDGNLPTSGTATFDGFVIGNVTLPDGQSLKVASLKGDASMTADFAAGTITGAAPNITATPLGTVVPGSPPTPGPDQAWNGLTFSGTMTSGINGFSGTTGVSSAPGNSYSLLNTASGFFAGLFYGPNANELGAVWNLADGVGAASGVLVGKQP